MRNQHQKYIVSYQPGAPLFNARRYTQFRQAVERLNATKILHAQWIIEPNFHTDVTQLLGLFDKLIDKGKDALVIVRVEPYGVATFGTPLDSEPAPTG